MNPHPDAFGGEDTPHAPSAETLRRTLRRTLTGLPGASYPCVGCDRWHLHDRVSLCASCGEVVCADCPATCPHQRPRPRQADFLAFWEGAGFGTYTAVTDKE